MIQLGNIAHDKLTGFHGTISSRHEHLSGMIQYGLSPQIKKGSVELPDANTFDECILVVDKAGIAKELPKIDDTVTIKLGEEVEDIVSGFRGIAVEIVTFINGCVYVQITSKTAKDKDGKPTRLFLSHRQLKIVGSGLTAKAPETQKLAEEIAKRPSPGGPSSRVMRP